MKQTVLFEYPGAVEDVVITMPYSQDAVRAIRELPSWARHYDATTRTWRVHPGYARSLAATLSQIGYAVVGIDLDRTA